MRIPPKNWRLYSTCNQVLSAKAVRSRFLEYFVNENEHEFVKSSPVLPQFDSTIPFVNAGMCQFKRVFTGEDEIDYDRAANTQKCIRVGGKHNDLNVVGYDSFHHTFFEMLGNWSFGCYGKKEACKLAWELLTKPPYAIPSHKLFVTYFGGNEELNLPPDEEIKEIWLELGVIAERILSFGMRDNFWEMGLTGPCGTCTEIHVALTDDLCSRPDLVNCDNPLLAELWNIVFINYNRTEQSIDRLPREFIDTGMGFERLVSLLQGKRSNYDTDLFQPLFTTIEKVTGAPRYAGTFNVNNVDVAYRCLADFSRMITVAITDNVFPDLNPKLRKVLRRALLIARSDFKQSSPERLLIELSRNVAESLHETFPEIESNFDHVKMIIEDEATSVNNMIWDNEDEWEAAKAKYPVLQSFSFLEYPGLSRAYEYVLNEVATSKGNTLPVEKVSYLFSTFGLDRSVIETVTSSLNVTVNWDETKLFQDNLKIRTKKSLSSDAYERILRGVGIKTDVSPRRDYSRTDTAVYSFPDVDARILAILRENKIVSVDVEPEKASNELRSVLNAEVDIGDEEIGLILNRTSFVCENRRGRRYDTGVITASGEVLRVNRIQRLTNFVVHYVKSQNGRRDTKLKAGIPVTLQLDTERRLNIMRNNLLSHLAYAALKDAFPLLYFQHDNSDHTFMNMRICVHGEERDLADSSRQVVEFVRKCIQQKIPVETTVVPSGMQVLKLPGVSLRPGFIYPAKNIEVIAVKDELDNFIFREPCTDVYVQNTADLENVCFMNLEKVGFAALNVTMAAGNVAEEVLRLENRIREQCQVFENERIAISNGLASDEKIINVSETLSPFVFNLMKEHSIKQEWFSIDATKNFNSMLLFKSDVDQRIAHLPEEAVIKYLKLRLQEQANSEKFAVYFSSLNMKAFKFKQFVADLVTFERFPSLLLTYSHEKLKGVCYVPDIFVTDHFNAEIWLKAVLNRVPSAKTFVVVNDAEYKNHCFLRAKYISPLYVPEIYGSLLEAGKHVAMEQINSVI